MMFCMGLTEDEIARLIKWAGSDLTITDVFFDAVEHSSKGQGALESLARLIYEWRNAGGSLPITERAIVFGPRPRQSLAA